MAEKPREIALRALWRDNPVFGQVLGICSTLAVTNLLVNTLFMCFGVVFTTALSSLVISLLRRFIPRRVRIIAQVLIIAAFVMMVDIIIKALAPGVHRFIGPYVGLIITNCIIMGRAEAFAMQNRPFPSLLDGLMSGVGYSLVLITIAIVREALGFGTIAGVPFPAREVWFHQWVIMIMPPGAFFMLAVVAWIARARLLGAASNAQPAKKA